MTAPLRRLNVFDGMLVTDEDFNAITHYQRRAAQLRNQLMVGCGVVPHHGGGLLVRAADPPGMRVRVSPGVAIDAEGREVNLSEEALLPIDPETLKGEGMPFTGAVFITLRYAEVPDGFTASEVDPRIHGYSRIEEGAQLRVSTQAPDAGEIELARIFFTPEVRRILDPPPRGAPQAGQIDHRYVPTVGQAAASPRGRERSGLIAGLRKRHHLLGRWLLDYHVMEAQLPRPAILGAVTHLLGGQLGLLGCLCQLEGILQYELEMTQLVQARVGEWERVWVSRPWKDYAQALERARQLLSPLSAHPPPPQAPEALSAAAALAFEAFRQVNPALERLTQELPDLLERGAASGPLYKEMTEAELRALSSEPPKRLALDGRPFELIDRLEPTNAGSVESHYFLVDAGANDVVQGTTSALYPDGVHVSDRGIALRRGSVYFHINEVRSGRDLLIVRRVELRELDAQEEVRLDEQPVGLWPLAGDDPHHLWRNMIFGIPGEHVVGPRPRLRLSLREGVSPTNMYRFWFYQAV